MRSAELKGHLSLPPKFIHQEADHEGPDEASKGEHGHRQRPQERQGKVGQVVAGPVVVGLVVEFFHELRNEAEQKARPV